MVSRSGFRAGENEPVGWCPAVTIGALVGFRTATKTTGGPGLLVARQRTVDTASLN